jgi:hypothetical protein
LLITPGLVFSTIKENLKTPTKLKKGKIRKEKQWSTEQSTNM